MPVLRHTTHKQRGVAALEFALVLPLFLALLGATFYFGLALYAKFLVLNAASSAVRTCVIKQVGWTSIGQFVGCANSEFSALTNNGSLGNMRNLCATGAPTGNAVPNSVAIGPLAANVSLLTLQVTCPMKVGGITWVAQTGNGAGGGQNQINVVISASMPFAMNQP